MRERCCQSARSRSRATLPRALLTLHGAANLAFRQSWERATGPDGEVDLGDVARDVAVAQMAADNARQRQRAQEEAHLLVGTAEREATVSFLDEQYARGTFDLDELEWRATLAMSANTRGDLAVATADLGWSPFPEGSDHAVLPRLEASFFSEGEPGLFSGPRDRRTAAVLADKAWAVIWIGFGASVVFLGFLVGPRRGRVDLEQIADHYCELSLRIVGMARTDPPLRVGPGDHCP